MIKLEYIVGAALVLFWVKGTKQVKQSTQVEDSIPFSGSDWTDIGNMWTRLNGTGLTASGYDNLAAGAQADPGKVGLLQTGLTPGWDGTL